MSQQTPDDDRSATVSRRALLAASGAGLSTLAGCSITNSPGNSTGGTPGQSNSVIQDVSFEANQMVVHLRDGHDVSQLNLISPDGSTFAQSQVATGATTVRLQLLSTVTDWYTPGEHKLVAVSGDTSTSMDIQLQPSLEIEAITPQVTEDEGFSTGKLLITVSNTGTGPTWVYNIGYRGAPYENAPQVKPGVVDTTFERPETTAGEYLTPDSQQVFLKGRGVLVIDGTDSVTCDGGEAEVTVVVQTVHGPTKQDFIAHLSGGQYVQDPGGVQQPCKNVTIERVSGGTPDE